jgi:hypothetical protein
MIITAPLIFLAVFLGAYIMNIKSKEKEKQAYCMAEKNEWIGYEKGRESSYVASQKCVFLFVYPELSPSSLQALRGLSISKLERLCGNCEYVQLLLKYDNWDDPRIKHIAQTVGFSKEPFIVFYSPGGETVALNPFSFKKIDFHRLGSQNVDGGVGSQNPDALKNESQK